MKITLYEFLALQDQEQYNLVFNEGVFIDYKIEGNQRFALYSIEMFFVEVEYDNLKNSIINKIAFKTGKTLDKYSFSPQWW